MAPSDAAARFHRLALPTLFTVPASIRTSVLGDFYDVSPDDQRFLMARFAGSVPGPPRQVVVVKNFDEVLRERGNNLSTGQKQLVAFARTLVHDPKILVMDEAASSVDPETEWMIHKAMTKLLMGRTALIIAHRLSTIRGADRIAVLHRARLQDVGTHKELLSRGGLYATLCRLQTLNGD